MDSKQIISYCKENNIKYAFFDYFGTIANRACSSLEIKKFWAKAMNTRLNFAFDQKVLFDVRIASEKKLHRLSENGEITYIDLCHEMYSRLSLVYRTDFLKTVSCEDFHAIALDVECNCETHSQNVISQTQDLIKALHNEKIKICVVSDFYLPQTAFIKFLEHHNLAEYIENVFVSCEYKINKRFSLLYDYVLETLKTSPKECIMVGDNPLSDIKNAENKGIKAFRIDTQEVSYKDKLNSNLKDLYKQNYTGTARYSNYCFLLYLFIERLYCDLIKDGTKNVYFLSREGEFLKKLFDAYIGNIPECDLQSHYLYVSRKATYPATFTTLDKESFEQLRKYKSFSVKDFLDAAGIDFDKFSNIFPNIDTEQKTVNFFSSEIFESLKSNKDFELLFNETAEANRNLVRDYLTSQGLGSNGEIAVLVDVGWNGTMQDNIYKILGHINCKGYYIGVTAQANSDLSNEKVGLIFSETPMPTKDSIIWKYDNVFLERVLWASHGATETYERLSSGELKPVLKIYDSEKNNFNLMQPVQNGIFAKFIAIDNLFKNSPYSAEDFYDYFKNKHIDTLFDVNTQQLKLQKSMIDNQMQNFGQISTAKETLDQTFGVKRILSKAFKKLYLVKNTEVVFRILQRYNANLLIQILYKTKKRSLRNK